MPRTVHSSVAVEWQALRLTGQEPLAVRASKKLRGDELLIASFAPSLLRMGLDRVPLWRGRNHVAIKQVIEDFASYLYLPRVKNPAVLVHTINNGTVSMTWVKDAFAYAEGYDEVEQRYRGIRAMQLAGVTEDAQGLLVKPGAAQEPISTWRGVVLRLLSK